MNINDKLKNLRKNKTQKEVSENIKIPYSRYNKYETTNTMPEMETLIKIADYYHTTIDYIVGHEVPYLINKSILSNVQLELFEKIQSLSDEDCKILSAYLDGMKSKKD